MLVNSPCCNTCAKRISHLQLPFRRMRMGELTTEDAQKVLAFTLYNEMTYKEKIDMVIDDENQLNEVINTPVDAKLAYEILGVVRPCCKARICDTPVWPIFSDTKPPGSNLILDEGRQKRILRRLGNGYVLDNYLGDIPNDVGDIDVGDIERELEDLPDIID